MVELLQGHAAPLGALLVQRGALSPSDLERALREQASSPLERFGEILLRLQLVEDAVLRAVLAEQYGLPFARLERKLVDLGIAGLLPRAFLQQSRLVPMFQVEGELTVAVDDPTNLPLLDEVARRTRCRVLPVVTASEDLDWALQSLLGDEERRFDIQDFVDRIDEGAVQLVERASEDLSELEEVAGLSPVVRLVNFILYRAIKDGASDIHVEPDEGRFRVRYRIDGELREIMTPPERMHPAIVSRIKVMADLDISERRRPQDGRLRVQLERRAVDLRVSTLPTIQGEKVVIRVLDRSSMRVDLPNLGLSSQDLERWKELIAKPDGILLVTGPTGSGKTTTLYAALQEINHPDLNICTVENPVEYHVRGINQIQAGERGGVGFADALRALLRQDPDVILIGEVRDAETAAIAVQASLTGHLVLATLHTNDSPSAVTRLVNMGVEPYLIAASLRGVLSQRLIRKLCGACRQELRVPESLRRRLGELVKDRSFFAPKGCDACRGTGYSGRIGLFELLVVDDLLADRISAQPDLAELRRTARASGLRALLDDGIAKAAEGITSLEEVLRVVSS
ncbi:MAG: Flp pilus assembly complex ATPase component TadA [Planctomycetes bacterium]|nr:Flp pilus assembly complex ATPase component TadA [Planctomycetota bacterium]